jgi:hypothetical protein
LVFSLLIGPSYMLEENPEWIEMLTGLQTDYCCTNALDWNQNLSYVTVYKKKITAGKGIGTTDISYVTGLKSKSMLVTGLKSKSKVRNKNLSYDLVFSLLIGPSYMLEENPEWIEMLTGLQTDYCCTNAFSSRKYFFYFDTVNEKTKYIPNYTKCANIDDYNNDNHRKIPSKIYN